jgi:hypothetical protein
MSRISKGAVRRAQKAINNNGRTARAWDKLGRWNRPGTFHHIYQACPIIFFEWAGQDVRWVHDNKSDVGLCPACEQGANSRYFNDLTVSARIVGEYQRRLRAQTQAQVDAAMEEVKAEMGLPA